KRSSAVRWRRLDTERRQRPARKQRRAAAGRPGQRRRHDVARRAQRNGRAQRRQLLCPDKRGAGEPGAQGEPRDILAGGRGLAGKVSWGIADEGRRRQARPYIEGRARGGSLRRVHVLAEGRRERAELTGRASIIDADTIEIRGQRIGFYGMVRRN